MELIDLLKGVELFAGLNTAQLQRLTEISKLVEYKDGDIIFERGAPGDALYIIRDGQVAVILTEGRTDARGVIYLGMGQIFGEMALIDRGERSATIQCGSAKVAIAVIRREDFETLCASDTAIGYVVMRNIANDISFKLRHRNMEPKSG
ncbi:cyclic nucleotide-binding domain-containing protein [Chloroflexota bacterium]